MDYFNTFLSYVTPTNIILYILLHVVTYAYALHASKYAFYTDPELDKKYAPFARTDKKWAFTWWRFPCK
jgi:hypothetical protein